MISAEMTEILRLLRLPARPGLAYGCVAALGMDHLVVSLAVDGRVTEQLWSSGETGASFDDVQFTLGQGPGPDTLRTGALTLEQDVSAVWSDRWPALVPAISHLPIRAVFCLPLALGGITVGVLTGVRSTPGPMSGQQMSDALALTSALTLQFLAGDDEELDRWTDDTPDGGLHRAVVHQATGMLSVQLEVPLGQALLRLRAYAYSQNLSIIDTAEDIVSRRLRLDDDRPKPDSSEETRG